MLAGFFITAAVLCQSSATPDGVPSDPEAPAESVIAEIPDSIREYLERSDKLHASMVAAAESRVQRLELSVNNSKAVEKARRKAELRDAEKVLAEIKSERHPKSPLPASLRPGEIGYVDVFRHAFVLNNSTLIAKLYREKREGRNIAVTGVGTRSIKLGRTNDRDSGQFWRYEGYVRVLPAEASAEIRKEFPEARDVVVAVEPVKTLEVEGFWKAYRAKKANASGKQP